MMSHPASRFSRRALIMDYTDVAPVILYVGGSRNNAGRMDNHSVKLHRLKVSWQRVASAINEKTKETSVWTKMKRRTLYNSMYVVLCGHCKCLCYHCQGHDSLLYVYTKPDDILLWVLSSIASNATRARFSLKSLFKLSPMYKWMN